MPFTLLLTTIAMFAFAANSLLARAALAGGATDALSFTSLRLVSGAVALGLLLLVQKRRQPARGVPGNWISGLSLLAYGVGFSLAYVRLGAATGALILFASVQASMIAWGVAKGQRPGPVATLGLLIALAAFVYLMLPGLHTPDPLGAAMMAGAGVAWGVYSLRGRGNADPTGETAGNFIRAGVLCLPLAAIAAWGGHAERPGIILAVISGVVTSALGYAIWYRALPGLKPIQAASVQLTVPVIAALCAVVLLGETLTLRLVVAGVCILGGVGLTIVAKR